MDDVPTLPTFVLLVDVDVDVALLVVVLWEVRTRMIRWRIKFKFLLFPRRCFSDDFFSLAFDSFAQVFCCVRCGPPRQMGQGTGKGCRFIFYRRGGLLYSQPLDQPPTLERIGNIFSFE